MKHAALAALIAATFGLVVCPAPARATAFGQLSSAEILPGNTHEFGGYLDVSDHAFGLLGQMRMSFYPGVDFGFQGGLTRFDYGTSRRTAARLGLDGRFSIIHPDSAQKLDVTLGGAIGVTAGDRYSVLTLGPEAVASRHFKLAGSAAVIPYVGAMMSFSSLTASGVNSTDFAIPIRVGAELTAAQGLKFLGELNFRVGDEINDHFGFIVGVNLPF